MRFIIIALLFIATLSSLAETYYVDASMPDDSADGLTWSTAKKTIQVAIDLAGIGDTIWVTNGVYDEGEAKTPDFYDEFGEIITNSLGNRVCIETATSVHSVNGPDVTVISADFGLRCAYVSNGGILSGFSLTGGYALGGESRSLDAVGGGALLINGGKLHDCTVTGNHADSGGGVFSYDSEISRCVIEKNTAHEGSGGGAYCGNGSVMNHCSINDNYAQDYFWDAGDRYTVEGYGGGVYLYGSTINNSLVSHNKGKFGGGVYVDDGELNNCTISDNHAFLALNGVNGGEGGGIYSIYQTRVNNSIIWGNTGATSKDCHSFYSTIKNSCLETFFSGTGNISVDPLFTGSANRNYGLLDGSLCINHGDNALAPSSPVDLAGNPRVVGETIDMGAFEEQTPLPMYLISALAGPNGSISPENELVFEGNDQTFLIQANGGFHIETVTVDGETIPITNSYTFTNVQTNHSLSATFSVNPDVGYVNASRPDDSGAGTNWVTAKRTIQAAVDFVASGGTVWVTNGIYDQGGSLMPGYNTSNRVCVTRGIFIRSVNGPDVTVIKGAPSINNMQAIRGICMQDGSSLDGFTIMEGHTTGGGVTARQLMGGGVWLSADCMISNCILKYNVGSSGGGGAALYYGGTMNNCLIYGNSSPSYGGAGVILYHGGTMNNCSVINNHAGSEGGGGVRMCSGGTLNNSIVWNNSAPGKNDIQTDYSGSTVYFTCASSGSDGVVPGINGCLTNSPSFVDEENNNFRLRADSAGINAGNNDYAPNDTDLSGSPRIIDTAVDLGAYEFYVDTDDFDNDGIPNEWEAQHFGAITNAMRNTICANGINTIEQAYIAGLDPNDPGSKFMTTILSNNVFQWSCVSGRVYSVYWATNLLDGFQPLETNIPWTCSSFTNSTDIPNAYFKVGVELEE